MGKKRMQYSTEFKAKIALAAIRGEEALPLQALALCRTGSVKLSSVKQEIVDLVRNE